MSTFLSRRGSNFRALRRTGIVAVDDARGATLTLTVDQDDGAVVGGALDEFNDADAVFVTDGVVAGDLLKLSTGYYVITTVTETKLTVSSNMSADTGIAYTVVRPDVETAASAFDMTDSTKAIILAKFTGNATEIQVHLECELDRSSTYRARIGTAVTLTGTYATGDAAIVEHGGCVIRARVVAVTPGSGSVDIAVIPCP